MLLIAHYSIQTFFYEPHEIQLGTAVHSADVHLGEAIKDLMLDNLVVNGGSNHVTQRVKGQA